MFKQTVLSIDDAKKIAAAGRAEAEKNGWKVVICVVDDGGHVMYLERMDGTQKASSTIAAAKGRTAIMFRRPSGALEKAVTGGRVAVMSLPGATTVEGGIPIVVDGEFVGAVGVSGVQSHEDAQVAQAGINALAHG